MSKVAVIGSLSFDTLLGAGSERRKLGGAVVYSGLTFGLLKHDTTIVCAVPEEEREWLHEALDGRIRCVFTESKSKTHFINREEPSANHGASRKQYVESLADAIQVGELPSESFEWIHLGPLHPGDFPDALVLDARSLAGSMSLDIQGWCRQIQGREVSLYWDSSRTALLEHFDWIKADRSEWNEFAASTGLDPASALKKFGWEGLLITEGAAGGRFYGPSEERSWSAVPADKIVSETGAGDVFTAAFASGVLAGEEAGAAIRHAAGLASCHVSGEWLSHDVLGFQQ